MVARLLVYVAGGYLEIQTKLKCAPICDDSLVRDEVGQFADYTVLSTRQRAHLYGNWHQLFLAMTLLGTAVGTPSITQQRLREYQPPGKLSNPWA